MLCLQATFPHAERQSDSSSDSGIEIGDGDSFVTSDKSEIENQRDLYIQQTLDEQVGLPRPSSSNSSSDSADDRSSQSRSHSSHSRTRKHQPKRKRTSRAQKKKSESPGNATMFSITITMANDDLPDEYRCRLKEFVDHVGIWGGVGFEHLGALGHQHCHFALLTDKTDNTNKLKSMLKEFLGWSGKGQLPKGLTICGKKCNGKGMHSRLAILGYVLKELGSPSFDYHLHENVSDDDLQLARAEYIKYALGGLKNRVALSSHNLLPRCAVYWMEHMAQRYFNAEQMAANELLHRDVLIDMIHTGAYYFASGLAFSKSYQIDDTRADVVFRSMVNPESILGRDVDQILFAPRALGDPDDLLYRQGKTLLLKVRTGPYLEPTFLPAELHPTLRPEGLHMEDFPEDHIIDWYEAARHLQHNKVTMRDRFTGKHTTEYIPRQQPIAAPIEAPPKRGDSNDPFATNDDFIPFSRTDDPARFLGDCPQEQVLNNRVAHGNLAATNKRNLGIYSDHSR